MRFSLGCCTLYNIAYFMSFGDTYNYKYPSLQFLIFLKRSLVFPILLFSSISLHWSLRKAFLSFLAIFWNSAFKWVYLSFSLLPFTSLLFSDICKASTDNYFAFLHFFFLGIVLITAFCTLYKPLSIVLQKKLLNNFSKKITEFNFKNYTFPV